VKLTVSGAPLEIDPSLSLPSSSTQARVGFADGVGVGVRLGVGGGGGGGGVGFGGKLLYTMFPHANITAKNPPSELRLPSSTSYVDPRVTLAPVSQVYRCLAQ
jgi:hypothetical protein